MTGQGRATLIAWQIIIGHMMSGGGGHVGEQGTRHRAVMTTMAGPKLSPGQHHNRANKSQGHGTGRVEGTTGQSRGRVGGNTKRLVLQE